MADNKNVIIFGALAVGALILMTRRASAAEAEDASDEESGGPSKPPAGGSTGGGATKPPGDSSSGGGSSGGGSSGGGSVSSDLTEAIIGAQGALNEFRDSVRLGFTDLSAASKASVLSTFSAPLVLDGRAGPATFAATRAFATAAGYDPSLFAAAQMVNAGSWWSVSDAVNDWLDEHERASSTPVGGEERAGLERRIQTALNRLRNTPAGNSSVTFLEYFNRAKAENRFAYNWDALTVDGVVGQRTSAAWTAFRVAAATASAAGGLTGTRLQQARAAAVQFPTSVAELSAAISLPTGNRAALESIANNLEALAGLSRV